LTSVPRNSALLIFLFIFTLSLLPTGHTEHCTCDVWTCSSWSPFGTQDIHQSKSSLELDGKTWRGPRAHPAVSIINVIALGMFVTN
jgi:hypothetical protein